MILFIFLLLNLTAFSSELIFGGSIAKESGSSDNKEYIRGAISFFNSVIDSDSKLMPKAIFYENDSRESRDISNTNRLIKSDKAKVLYGYSLLGSMKDVITKAKESGVLFAFPRSSLKEDFLKEHTILSLRPSIEKDLLEIAKYVNSNFKGRKVALLCDKRELWQRNYLAEHLTEDIILYDVDYLGTNRAILEMKKIDPEVIILLGDRDMMLNFMKKSRFTNLSSSIFVLPFYFYSSEVKERLSSYSLEIYIGKILPNLDCEDEVVERYIRDHDRYYPDYLVGDDGLEGYISSMILFDLVINQNTKDFDRSSHIEYRVESLKR